MEFLIPIYRLIHFIGFALLLGGTFSSMVLTRKSSSIKEAWLCMHLVAAPGLMLLLITGILHSSVIYWENFKGAYYMHAKVLLALILLFVMIADMRTQKNIMRAQPESATLEKMLTKRQALGMAICLLSITIMWLVSFRPF